MHDIQVTCPKCAKPTELHNLYCRECAKELKTRRRMPKGLRVFLWLMFVAVAVGVFLSLENLPAVRDAMHSLTSILRGG